MANYISELDTSLPNGAIDLVSSLDNYIRDDRRVLTQSFPKIDRQVIITAEHLNQLANNMKKSTSGWDVNNNQITNVQAADFDHAVEPRKYNDDRYLRRSNNLSDLTDKNKALENLMNGIMAGSAGANQIIRLVGNAIEPVGTIYENANRDDSPSTYKGFGVWARFGEGRVTVGAGTITDTRGEQRSFNRTNYGGEFSHQLTQNEMPRHNHGVPLKGSDRGGNQAITSSANNNQPTVISSNDAGGDAPHNNMQPYIVVARWVRTG